MSALGSFPKLEWLSLRDNPVGDNGLRELAGLATLRTLWIGGTQVTDSGLLQLATLKRLTVVNAVGSRVSPAGVEALFLAQQDLRRSSKRGAREAAPGDDKELAEATRVLREFLLAMAAWNAETVRAEMEDGTGEAFQAERAQAKREVFARWCTQRRRVYDSPDQLVYSLGTSLSRIPEVTSAHRMGPRRIEVIVRGQLDERLLYVLLKQRGRWLVDHNKMWMDGGWSVYSLNLVN
jgi:hypothetical protein